MMMIMIIIVFVVVVIVIVIVIIIIFIFFIFLIFFPRPPAQSLQAKKLSYNGCCNGRSFGWKCA